MTCTNKVKYIKKPKKKNEEEKMWWIGINPAF